MIRMVLPDDRNLAAQAGQVPIAHVDAVDQNTPVVHVIDALEQLGDRALAAACLPDRQVKRDACQGIGGIDSSEWLLFDDIQLAQC